MYKVIKSRLLPVDYNAILFRTSSEWRTWYSMWQRTIIPSTPHTKKIYIDRGIKVCDRWLSFEVFLSDMGKKPTKSHTIDRINGDGNYEPRNCRWATKTEQSWNRRGIRWITYKGETLPMAEWARRIGINNATMMERLNKYSVEQALSAPKFKRSLI